MLLFQRLWMARHVINVTRKTPISPAAITSFVPIVSEHSAPVMVLTPNMATLLTVAILPWRRLIPKSNARAMQRTARSMVAINKGVEIIALSRSLSLRGNRLAGLEAVL